MIILFYILTPIILLIKQKSYITLFVVCITVYLLFIIGNKFLWFDERLAEYWPFYLIPLLIPQRKDLFSIFHQRWHYSLTLVICLLVTYLIANSYSMDLGYCIIVSNAAVCFIILSISTLIEKIKPLSKVLCMFSFASMFAYLFHREVYIASTYIVGHYTYIYAALFAIILFMLSYWMQYAYEKISKIIFK